MPSGEFINMKKLELKNIKKTYNETIVLDGFSAICDSSKPSCIMGESGAGKTTLLILLWDLSVQTVEWLDIVFNQELS